MSSQSKDAATSQESAVQIQLLGRFSVSVGGQVLAEDAWPGRRAAELVQLLALSDRFQLLSDQVIEALWPHLDPEPGAANLRKAAHHARRALATPEAIVLRRGRVSLFPSRSVQTDVAAFEAAAEEALARGDPEVCIEAAGAYHGELLPDSLYEEWTQAPRQRLRSRYLDLLRMGEQWERLVEVEPTEESAYRELMRAAMSAGEAHAAIRWYGRLRTTLLGDLGMLPSHETNELYDECVSSLSRHQPVFVGRQVELARATAVLRAEASPGVTALVVRGPAGIGKSALCRQVTAAARTDGWIVISTEARDGGIPYAPVSAMIDQLVARDRSLLDAVGGRSHSVLAELTALATPAEPLQSPLTRHQVIGAVRRLLLVSSDGAGVVFVLDDAHAADEATIDVVFHLAAAGSRPILVVLAYRPERAPDSLSSGVARLARGGRTVEIDLGPLDRDEAVALATASVTSPPTPAVADRLADLAEGNPFFILELATSAGVDENVPIGSTVWDAIRARFVDLDEGAAAMLRRLALASDDVDPARVVALTSTSEEQAFTLLDKALAAGVLTVTGEGYRFRHELVRQALINQLPPHQRIAVHRDAARRLAGMGVAPAIVARHWLFGGRPDKAIPWLLDAARQAIKLGAFADSLAHLGRLLDHAPGHVDALCLRAEALDALGDSGAPAAYAGAAAVAGEPASQDIRAKQALAQLKLGDPPGALQTVAGVSPATLEGQLAEALTLAGAAAIGFASPDVGAAKAAESRRLALQSGDPAAAVVASWAHAAAAHARGDLRESLRADLRETAALPTLAATIFDGQLCITQRLLYGARPYSDVVAFADSLAAEAKRLGAVRGYAFAVTLRGEAELLAGQLDAAEKDLTAGAELHRAIHGATGEALALQRRAELALCRGQRIDTLELLDDALAVARESDVGFHLLDRIYGTRIAAAPDPTSALAALEEAEAAVRGPIETCPGCRITFAVPAAIAAAHAGDMDRAAAHTEATEMLATVIMRLPAWYAALDEVRGHVAAAAGSHEQARRHFLAAAEEFRNAGQPLDEARCAELAVHR